MTYFWYFELPVVGRCGIGETDACISHVFLPESTKKPLGIEAETPLLQEAALQLEEYFIGQRQTFTLPLSPAGTPFQRAVWQLLLDIPYGQTISYGALAAQLGRPGGAQAVGQAVGANPIPFLIPCHRVIGKNGAMTGFALGLELKQTLLHMEGI